MDSTALYEHKHAAMAAPVLVRPYAAQHLPTVAPALRHSTDTHVLPPVSSYAFTNVLRSADCADFQDAIDGIADLFAKSRMSLAGEHASHMPPLGEITASNSAAIHANATKPGMRRALTSVPEASSGSSEGSSRKGKSNIRKGLFGFMRKEQVQVEPMRKVRIGSMGRTITVSGTTAVATHEGGPRVMEIEPGNEHDKKDRPTIGRSSSRAIDSLQRLLGPAQARQRSEG